MKKKISFILIGSVVLATPCFALFGEDIAYLIQIINQGRQAVQVAREAKSKHGASGSIREESGELAQRAVSGARHTGSGFDWFRQCGLAAHQ
jgi:hypothetical protein